MLRITVVLALACCLAPGIAYAATGGAHAADSGQLAAASQPADAGDSGTLLASQAIDKASGTCGTCNWVIDSSGHLTVSPISGTSGELDNWLLRAPWALGSPTSITSVSFNGTIKASTCHGMFEGCTSLTSADLKGLDTSHVTDMDGMFRNCMSLAFLDLSSFDTSNVASPLLMFTLCTSLSEIKLGQKVTKLGDLPDRKWLSLATGKVFTSAQIGASRLGIADTFVLANIENAVVSGLKSKTYNAKPQTQSAKLTLRGWTLKEGVDYTVSYRDRINAGTATVTFRGTGDYSGSQSAKFTIVKAKVSSASVSGITNRTYTGDEQVQNVARVIVAGRTLVKGNDYTVSYKNNVKAGKATVTFMGKGNYTGSKAVKFTIAKAKQPMTAWAKTGTLKAKALKKKAIALKKHVIVKRAQGTVTYKKATTVKKLAKFKVNSKDGAITVPKNTQKGVYRIKVKATAKGNANYKAGSKTVSVKITVK